MCERLYPTLHVVRDLGQDDCLSLSLRPLPIVQDSRQTTRMYVRGESTVLEQTRRCALCYAISPDTPLRQHGTNMISK
jgi:hypothetical protein